MKKSRDHMELVLHRRWVDEKLRYQAQCACGRMTEITSRRDAQIEQKAHRKEMMRKG